MWFNKGAKARAKHANAQEPLLAMDIGSNKIRLIVGEVNDNGEVNVTYFDECPSDGVLNSSVSDIDKLSNKLSSLIESYEAETEQTFSQCVIGMSGIHIESINYSGEANVPTGKITEIDRNTAIDHAAMYKFSESQHLIHVVPQAYFTKRDNEVSNPIGMSSSYIKVNAHLITCNEDQENDLRAAFERLSSNISIDEVIYNGIAAADAVLSQEQKEIGVCLVDIGGGSTSVAVYDKGKLVMTFGLKLSGNSITQHVATKLNLPLRVAEFAKRTCGLAHPCLLEDGPEFYSVTPKGYSDPCLISVKELATNIGFELMDITRVVLNRVQGYYKETGQSLALGAGFVITGGVAKTVGIDLLIQATLKDDKVKTVVNIGKPRGVTYEGDEEEAAKLDSPEWATAIGLLRVAYSMEQDRQRRREAVDAYKSQSGTVAKTLSWIKAWLAKEF